jgi:D-glycerate 3-kinase
MSPEPILEAFLEDARRSSSKRPLVVGLCGAQGSGKSTLATALAKRLPGTVALSLDDFYLTHDQRVALGRDVHPLLATRGPPGTHDVDLALETLAALDRGEATVLPRFDKANDDRADRSQFRIASPSCDLVIFEGWCVGARPQAASALATPVNALERLHDPDGVWRRYVNDALGGPYQRLFARLDRLMMLRAPRWQSVLAWRLEQEHALKRSESSGTAIMTDREVETFISYYERVTRHILDEMPRRADLVLDLAESRNCTSSIRKVD